MSGQRLWLGIGLAGMLAPRGPCRPESMRSAPQYSPMPASAALKAFGAVRAHARQVTGGSPHEIRLLTLCGALPLRRRPASGRSA